MTTPCCFLGTPLTRPFDNSDALYSSDRDFFIKLTQPFRSFLFFVEDQAVGVLSNGFVLIKSLHSSDKLCNAVLTIVAKSVSSMPGKLDELVGASLFPRLTDMFNFL